MSALPPAAPVPDGALVEGEDERIVSVLTNAIGFEICHADGRERVLDGENVKIEVSDEDLVRHRSAAVRVLRELRAMGALA